MLTRTAFRISRMPWLIAASFIFAVAISVAGQVSAAPRGMDSVALRAQNVDWMGAEEATALDLPFSVLVPTWIPAPFAGSPAISGDGGYYSLYWVNYGGAPTFLRISGEVGGSLPAGSPADLNVQLSVNASVQGYDAIHDVTDIYDNVWWVANGVLYEVSSNNMTGTDSLSLANSLIQLQPPVVEEPNPPTPTPPPVDEADVTESDTDTETDTDIDTETEQSIQLDNRDNQATDTPTEVPDDSTTGVGGNFEATVEAESTPTTSLTEAIANTTASTTPAQLSDGTAGPALPSGGDGTGGIRQVAIP